MRVILRGNFVSYRQVRPTIEALSSNAEISSGALIFDLDNSIY